MLTHEQQLRKIKSDILDMFTGDTINIADVPTCIRILDSCLQKYFNIEESIFLKLEADLLFPIEQIYHIDDKRNAIPWAMLKPYFYQQDIISLPPLFLDKPLYEDMTVAFVIRNSRATQPLALYLFKGTPQWQEFSESSSIEEFITLYTNMLYKVSRISMEQSSEERYRKLFEITDLFHSTMDIDVILNNMLITLQKQLEHLHVEVILSNDQDRQTTMNIKLFDYMSERPSTIEAFVSGEITIEQATDLNCRLLNAPIKGRQAIYGILQITAPNTYVFSAQEKEFIRMLADASGNALENAKLYRQSHRLVSDLQLINETSHRLNMKMEIDQMLAFLKVQLLKSFQPQEVCFIFHEEQNGEAIKEATEFFDTPDADIYINYVEHHFKYANDALFIADFSRQVPEKVRFSSMMAIPMLIEEKIYGYSIVLHEEPYFFPFDSFKLMQSLIHHSSLAMANTILQNQLQEMVDRDHLTKLYARSYLDKYVEQALDNYAKGMFFLIDIDNFKRVNDTYGHQIGDEVLVQISKQLKAMVGDKGICARWGGEELAVCIPNVSVAYAKQVAQKFVEVMPTVTKPQVTISAGLITWNTEEQPIFKSIFSQADDALYQAKNSGKNRFVVYGE